MCAYGPAQPYAHNINKNNTSFCSDIASGSRAYSDAPTAVLLHSRREGAGGGYLIKGLAVVYANHRADHLRHDDHISQMRAYWLRLFARWRLLFSLSQLFDERQGLALEPSLKPGRDTDRSR